MILNRTTNIAIANQVILFPSFFQKARGLMFRKPEQDTAYIFPFKNERIIGIHMLFVFSSIDVLWLNAEKEVVEKRQLKSWTFYHPKTKANYVIELAAGTGKQVKEGNILTWGLR